MFMSEGFGGRASDIEVVQNSGFLDIIPENSVVLADRGFKSLESTLTKKNCKLLRPPSVINGQKSTEEENLRFLTDA